MAGEIVYDGNSKASEKGVFAGQVFWLSKTVPQRERFVIDIETNGGKVVVLEAQANVRLYDHARKNPPPNVHSYRYVEYTIRNGELENLEDHKIDGIDTRAERPVGSTAVSSKGGRTPFTDADDQFLWNWVKPLERLAPVGGNRVYQELEMVNPKHTYQSWRDRWIKKVQFQNRQLTESAAQTQPSRPQTIPAPVLAASPGSRRDNSRKPGATAAPRVAVEVAISESPRRRDKASKQKSRPEDERSSMIVGPTQSVRSDTLDEENDGKQGLVQSSQPRTPPITQKTDHIDRSAFTRKEREALLNSAAFLLEWPTEQAERPWRSYAKAHPEHTAAEWRQYFENVIVPLHRRQMKAQDDTEISETFSQRRSSSERRSHLDVPNVKSLKRQITEDNHQPKSNRGTRTQTVEAPNTEPARHRPNKRPRLQDSAVLPGRASTLGQSPGKGTEDMPKSMPKSRQRSAVKDPVVRSSPSSNSLEVEEEEHLPSRPSRRAAVGVEDEGAAETARQIQIDRGSRTSSIDVRLFSSDHEVLGASSSSTEIYRGSRSPTPQQYETAPTIQQIYEVTSAEEDQPDEVFETATEGRQSTSIAKSETDAQAHFNTDPDLSDLTLPEPEGGWAAWEIASSSPSHSPSSHQSPPPYPSGTQASTVSLPMSEWHALRTAQGQDPALLLAASAATNMHTSLADRVYAFLADQAKHTNPNPNPSSRSRSRSSSSSNIPTATATATATITIPDTLNIRGVWTTRDDEALMGADARAIEALMAKHGRKGVDERWECLAVMGGEEEEEEEEGDGE